jgi:hypothetical protein
VSEILVIVTGIALCAVSVTRRRGSGVLDPLITAAGIYMVVTWAARGDWAPAFVWLVAAALSVRLAVLSRRQTVPLIVPLQIGVEAVTALRRWSRARTPVVAHVRRRR